MQALLTKSAIEAYAKALADEGSQQAAGYLKQLLSIFHGFASKPLDELLAFLDTIDLAPGRRSQGSNGDTVSAVTQSLRNLEYLLSKCSTRKRVNDLIALRIRLSKHESATIVDLLQAVKVQRRGKGDGGTMEPVALAKKLKDALGDDEQFGPLFKALSKLDAANVARVADILMSSGSSKSRKKDLSRIRERHEALRTLNAKERATAGRSAA